MPIFYHTCLYSASFLCGIALEVLPLAGEGMLGVFATIIVLIAGVALLNRFGKKKS